MTGRPGTEGYTEEAAVLVERYESIAFADLHRRLLPLFPAAPSRILDIGAGTGRDAAALARLGHAVTAVEPTSGLREAGMRLHPSPNIEWIDDGLPELGRLNRRDGHYDLVLLTAVLMHLDAEERRAAMPRLASLIRAGGLMMISLRHGPVPPGRRMFDVSADDVIASGRQFGLVQVAFVRDDDSLLGQRGVSWSRLALRRTG